MEKVEVNKEDLQKLVSNFFSACSLADEMDIYEWAEGDEEMQEMKQWVEKNFGRKLEKVKKD